jgi:hypothetical protein
MSSNEFDNDRLGVPSRRDFLKTAGKVAVTAPAVSLLVAVPSVAQAAPVDKYGCIIFDDATGAADDLNNCDID